MIVKTAVQEDVDVVGMSILSGAHLQLFPLVAEGLKKEGMGNVLVIAGGIIPEDDIPALQQADVKAVFGPGTPTSDIINFIQKELAAK